MSGKVIEKLENIFEKALSNDYIRDLDEERLSLYKKFVNSEKKYIYELYEKTTSSEVPNVAQVFIPVVKKLARDSFIEEIVGVQPIKQAIAGVRYLDYVYSKTDTVSGAQQGESIFNEPKPEYSRDVGEGNVIDRGIDVKVRVIPVQAKVRKLIGSWDFEATINAEESGIDLSEELTKALSYKITEDINYEILYDLYSNAGIVHADVWEAPKPTDSPREVERKERDLVRYILDVAGEIFDKVGVYPNFIVVSPKVASFLKGTGKFEIRGQGLGNTFNRLYYEASLDEEFKVIVVRGLRVNDILIGYKGNSEIESGYIYAPHVPLVVFGDKLEPETLSWVRAIATFYAKVMIEPKLYGVVKVRF